MLLFAYRYVPFHWSERNRISELSEAIRAKQNLIKTPLVGHFGTAFLKCDLECRIADLDKL